MPCTSVLSGGLEALLSIQRAKDGLEQGAVCRSQGTHSDNRNGCSALGSESFSQPQRKIGPKQLYLTTGHGAHFSRQSALLMTWKAGVAWGLEPEEATRASIEPLR